MGKLHLNGGAEMESHPQANDMGFDYSYIMTEGWAQNKKVETRPADGGDRHGKIYPDNFWRDGKKVGETNDYSAGVVTNEVINWLDNQGGDKPFFVYIPYSEVHTPIASPKKYLDMYSDYISDYAKETPELYHWDWKNKPYRGEGEYYANISYMDAQLGRVIKKLEEMGESEDTIIVFASDNGPVTREARKPWELNMSGETGGLRGRKDNLLEGGIRVPGIIKYSKTIKAGQVSNEPVSGLDLMPTLAEMMDFEVPADRIIDGQSVTATMQGKPVERKKTNAVYRRYARTG